MIFVKKTIKNIDLKDKTVLVRVDFNVPLSDGEVKDDYRIEKALPTIRDLIEQRAKVVLCSHLGRPNGRKDRKYSLLPVLEVLKAKLGQDVMFSSDCISDEAFQTSKTLKSGEVHLLENLRFYSEEEVNDKKFAEKLSKHGEIFVQDGFGVVHRKHASTDAITKYLPSVAGLLVEHEVRVLTKVANHPAKPLGVIIGGAKIEGKIGMINHFIKKADVIAIGGAMANTFLQALGHNVGKSIYDQNELKTAKDLVEKCQDSQTHLLLPRLDVAVADKIDHDAQRREVELDDVEDNDIILDIGKNSTQSLIDNFSEMKTVIWNGPLGMTEFKNFAYSSNKVAEALAQQDNFKLVGGGDTAEFIRKGGFEDKFNHVSTGGGASLEILSGGKLPGVEALLDKKH